MIESENSVARRSVCYSAQAATFLEKCAPDRVDKITNALEGKFWQAQEAGTNHLPSWRAQRMCALGPACYVIQGQGFGALVQSSLDMKDIINVHLLARTANDIMKGMRKLT
jgi:hypothetical protein